MRIAACLPWDCRESRRKSSVRLSPLPTFLSLSHTNTRLFQRSINPFHGYDAPQSGWGALPSTKALWFQKLRHDCCRLNSFQLISGGSDLVFLPKKDTSTTKSGSFIVCVSPHIGLITWFNVEDNNDIHNAKIYCSSITNFDIVSSIIKSKRGMVEDKSRINSTFCSLSSFVLARVVPVVTVWYN